MGDFDTIRWKLSYINFMMLLASIPDYSTTADGDREVHIRQEDEQDSLLRDIG